MAPEELVAALRRRPFIPFRLTLMEGTSYEIRHPELCLAGRHTAHIGLASPNDPDLLFERAALVDLLHVVKLDLLEPSTMNTNGPS